MKKIVIILFVGFLNTQLSSCQPKTRKMEKFDWSHTLSAPKGYPMRIYKGTLKGLNSDDYSASFGLWGVANEGWGKPSGMVAVGPDLKAIPDNLEVTWLSFTENKFYEGKFKLPREKIIQLFQDGFYDYGLKIKDNYTEIIVGLAPGGVVVIWLLGGQVETEVARFQAAETTIDKNTANSNNEDMLEDDYVDFILNSRKIERAPVPFGLWDLYREKYTWKPVLVLPEGCKIDQVWITLFNGEKEHLFSQDPKFYDFKSRAIPQELNFTWYDPQGIKYYGKDFFDEAEIFKAFQQLYKTNKDQASQLIFKLNDQQKGFSIHLQGKTEEFELEKVKNRAFPESK
jgi:hypothetical protein